MKVRTSKYRHKNKIEDFTLHPLKNPHYTSPYLATYRHDGVEKDWEIIQAHDSVAILLYHREKEAFVLVRQFRAAVYLNNQDGLTVELCAGIVDKEIPLHEIAREEIEEECGFAVDSAKIERISSFYTSVGFAGAKQTLYYAEVDEDMRVSEGGGIEDEAIEVIYLPLLEAKDFIYDERVAKTPGLMFAFMWWYDTKHRR